MPNVVGFALLAGIYAFSDAASLRASAAAGLTEISASLNRNRNRVTEIPTRIGRDGNPFSFVNEEAVFDTENALSKTQGFLALRHWWKRFDVMGRVHYYGDYRHANSANFADPENVQRVSGKILVDLQASWRASDTFSVTLGGQMSLAKRPTKPSLRPVAAESTGPTR